MALTAGTKLGPYEIQSAIGAGGMGEVYRARDTRLDRTVAVKILPEHLAKDADARQRFEREARSISSLNHPNICVLHDVGVENGTSYLVMEYVQGETMESRLRKGPLPLKQALEYGIQICEALEKAHRAGIVHRDLKPGNIMLTPSGAKLLDFGLAKPVALLGTAPANKGNLTPSTPTMNLTALASPVAVTQQGSVVGTFQYMAPELLQGHEADARSDIFSFGCVLYEMLLGRRAFEGKSQLSVASAILEKDPEPITKIQPMTPISVDHVVQTCLAKDPEKRWQNATDVGHELRWIVTVPAPTSQPESAQPKESWTERLLWLVAIAALAGMVAWLSLRGHPQLPVLRSFLPPPANTGFDLTGDYSGPPVLASDGSAVAFCARPKGGQNSIWVHSFGELSARKLDGTEGASFPFWSPDNKFLGFFAEGHLKKVAASGGPVTILADTPNPRGGTWNQENVIVYEPDYRDSLWRVSSSGAGAVRLTKFEGGKHTTHRWPWFLPDGKHFLFFGTNHSGNSEQGIYFASLADGSYKHVVDSDSGAQYASGYLLYHLQSQLFAQKFDPTTGTLSGDPITVANLIDYDAGTWHTTFTASQNGLLIYEPGTSTTGTDLLLVDRSGKILKKLAESAAYKGTGQLSPDGKRLAISIGDPQADVWILDLVRGSKNRLTFGGATHLMPSWSADGQRVAYVKQVGATVVNGTSLCSRLANGGGQEEVLLSGQPTGLARTLLLPQWSNDGRYLVHLEQSGPSGAAVWAVDNNNDKKLIPIVQPPSQQARILQFRLSPDNRWIAYSSTESGREEIYVTRFPSGEGKWQVSQVGGAFPDWRADGKEIFFMGLDGNVSAADVHSTADGLELGPARHLFQNNYTAPIGNPFEAAPDGKQLVLTMVPESLATPLVLVTNWTAEMNK